MEHRREGWVGGAGNLAQVLSAGVLHQCSGLSHDSTRTAFMIDALWMMITFAPFSLREGG